MNVASNIVKSISVPNISSLLNPPPKSPTKTSSSIRKSSSMVIKTKAAVTIQKWYRAKPKLKPKPVEQSKWKKLLCYCCKKPEVYEEEITVENIMSEPAILEKKHKKTLLQQQKLNEKRNTDKRRESQKIRDEIEKIQLRKQKVKPDLSHISNVQIIEPNDEDLNLTNEEFIMARCKSLTEISERIISEDISENKINSEAKKEVEGHTNVVFTIEDLQTEERDQNFKENEK